MKIPKKVKVGGLSYNIEIVDDLGDASACGTTDYNKGLITIEKATNKEFEQQVFLHEVLHAINNEMPEERIEFLAMALYQFIKENPEVFNNNE